MNKLNTNTCDELTFDDFFTNNFGYEYDIRRNSINQRFKSLKLSNSTNVAAAAAAATTSTSNSKLNNPASTTAQTKPTLINTYGSLVLNSSNKMTSPGQHSCSSSASDASNSTTSSPSSLTSSGASSPTSPSHIRKNVRELINKAQQQQQMTTSSSSKSSSFSTVLPNRFANTKSSVLTSTTSFKHSPNHIFDGQTATASPQVKPFAINKANSQSTLLNTAETVSVATNVNTAKPGTIYKLNNPFIKNNFESIDNSKLILAKHANYSSGNSRVYKSRNKSSEARSTSNCKNNEQYKTKNSLFTV